MKRKTKLNFYAELDYDKEIERLNKLSKEGWHLEKGGLLSKFIKDDSI